MKYDRILANFLEKRAAKQKARLIFGARQTGKSTLFSMIAKKNPVS
jgi:predicted AAA+ superfamily ATPase